jgi:hypothetical protein
MHLFYAKARIYQKSSQPVVAYSIATMLVKKKYLDSSLPEGRGANLSSKLIVQLLFQPQQRLDATICV